MISCDESSWMKWLPLTVTSFKLFQPLISSLWSPTSIKPGSAFTNNFGIDEEEWNSALAFTVSNDSLGSYPSSGIFLGHVRVGRRLSPLQKSQS